MKDTIIEHMGQVIGSYRTDARRKGYKQYEILVLSVVEVKNHLGNVRAVISDVKNPLNPYGSIDNWRFRAEILNLNNYYPYGLQIPTGIYSSNADYTYGYNGMEKDDELKSGGKLYSTLFREGDTENGRWWSRDPLEMNIPYQSPYITMDANPIRLTDVYGNSTEIKKEEKKDKGGKTKSEKYTFELKGAILNTSDIPIDTEKFKENYIKSLQLTSTGSEEIDGVEVSWTATSVELRVINSLDELNEDEHLIEITNEKVADGNAYASANGFDGMFIEFTVAGALQMVQGIDIRRGAHEWFHTAGLYHPEVYKISLQWWEDGLTPPKQQIPDTKYLQNVIRQTWKWKELNSNLETKGLGMKLNAKQVRIIYQNYINNDININDKPSLNWHKFLNFINIKTRYYK